MVPLMLIVLLLGFGAKVSETSGILSFKLETFSNPSNKDFDGRCCDEDEALQTCTKDCDSYLILCLSSSNLTKRCDYGELWMGDGAEEVLPTSFGSRITISNTDPRKYYDNPYNIHFQGWNGTFAFKIQVFDDDTGVIDSLNHPNNEKVDELSAELRTNAYQNATIAKNNTLYLVGKNVQMRMSAKVWCDKNYFIPDCTEYCKDTNDSTGHYKCNYGNGTKECLQGWYGDHCNTTTPLIPQCYPRNDTFGHYTCNAMSGEKICLKGWYDVDTNCTKEMNDLNLSLNATASQASINPTITVNPRTPASSSSQQLFVTPPSKNQSKININNSIPKLEREDFSASAKPDTTESKDFNANFVVYFCGLIIFTILLISAFVGVWKFVPTFKKFRAVAPVENWQQTRRKRTISTKTGMPPIPSTKISFQATGYNGIDTNTLKKSRIGSKTSVIQVKTFDSGPGSKKTKSNGKNKGERKVTFANLTNNSTSIV